MFEKCGRVREEASIKYKYKCNYRYNNKYKYSAKQNQQIITLLMFEKCGRVIEGANRRGTAPPDRPEASKDYCDQQNFHLMI